ncbi:hypothetical protein MKC73_01130 [[Clostridium] innocuum]|nr:hypothetical protein [[Clostridium] innocuum]
MKKKRNERKHQEKEQRKRATKERRRCATALEWSDIERIEGDAIYLKDGNTQERIIGLKVIPRNIFIDTSYVQARVVNNLRIVFNKLRFPVYWGYVFVPVQIDDHIAALMREEAQEEDPRIRAMIRNDFEKVTWFQDTHRELEFFLMLRSGDGAVLMKEYDELIAELRYAGFRTKDLNTQDLYDYVAYMYENPLINDYYFSRGVFSCLNDDSEDIFTTEDVYHEPDFDYDDYYRSEAKEGEHVG